MNDLICTVDVVVGLEPLAAGRIWPLSFQLINFPALPPFPIAEAAVYFDALGQSLLKSGNCLFHLY